MLSTPWKPFYYFIFRDKDGISDVDDNCPYFPNAAQIDTDSDGIGRLIDSLKF